MYKVLIIFLLCIFTLFPQKHRKSPAFDLDTRVYSDIIYLPEDSLAGVYFTYKIPYGHLIFEKEDEIFSAKYRIASEVFTQSEGFIDRQISEGSVVTHSFESTYSEKEFVEGFLYFRLESGNYKIITRLTDLNARKEIRLRNANINIDGSLKFFQPLIVSKNNGCTSGEYQLANYEGNIPFDGKNYDLLIPLTNADSIYTVELINNNWKYFSSTQEDIITGKASLSLCEGSIFTNFDTTITNISFIKVSAGQYLLEGTLTINLLDKSDNKLRVFRTHIKWYDKPYTLKNRETALRLLKYIDEDETYKFLSQADEQDFDSLFFNYWKQYDPTPHNSFNELMNEYYNRADYAANNFSSLTGKPGLDSDRGKIYIKFGKPVKTERTSDEKGKVIEIWEYANNKIFSFIDERGTGEFNLVNK